MALCAATSAADWRGDLLEGVAGGPLDCPQPADLARGEEGQRVSGAARPAGAADAVHVGLRLAGCVEVDDQVDPLDVETAGGDVGGDQHVEPAVTQPLDDPLAFLLRHVAVHRRGGNAAGDEVGADLVAGVLGADEHDGGVAVGDLQDAGQRVDLVPERDDRVGLPDGVDRGRLPGHGDVDRVVEVLAGDGPDGRRHGRGEQRGLPLAGGVGEDAVDVLGEAHPEHFVGLVQDQELQSGQVQGAALEVVDDPAGGADDDLRAGLQRGPLRQEAGPAVDRDDGDRRQVRGEGGDRLGDLHGEFTGRGEHQCLHAAVAVDRREQRHAEGGGLSGAGLRDTGDVAAGQQRGDGSGLDGGGDVEAEVGGRAEQLLGQVEVGEARESASASISSASIRRSSIRIGQMRSPLSGANSSFS